MRRWCLGVAILGLAGCAPPPTPVPGNASSSAPPPATAAPKATPSAKQAEPAGFRWTDQPTLDNVPTDRLVGYVGGRTFTAKAVVIERVGDAWVLQVASAPLASLTAPLTDGEWLSLPLPAAPTVGQTLSQPLRHGGGFWRILDPEDPTTTSNWSAANAWALRLSEWRAEPYKRQGPPAQVVGRAAGRVAVCYQGNARLPNAWLAGTFSEAALRYLAPPSG
ncbi:MAG: hypothetical protein HZB16_13685 [Armatimonadetes bacterium]|nr:hypothetical protein [Armatimonadota bacterium]